MNENPVKLEMSFEEVLKRLAKTPNEAIRPVTNRDDILDKARLKATVEQQRKTAPTVRKAR